MVYVAATVLPMGFSGATAIMQHWHRSCALGRLPSSLEQGVEGLAHCEELRTDRPVPFASEDGERGCWSIYFDDFGDTVIVDKNLVSSREGLPSARQLALRGNYDANKVPRGVDKAAESQAENKHLGCLLDGQTGVMRVAGERSLEIVSIILFVLSHPVLAILHLQVLGGKLAHVLQLRRPLWC